mgnify:CR=1 FL=1
MSLLKLKSKTELAEGKDKAESGISKAWEQTKLDLYLIQEEMKEKKQELELSFISESSGFKHKIIDTNTVAVMTKQA